MRNILFYLFALVVFNANSQSCDSLVYDEFIGKKVSVLNSYLESKGVVLTRSLLLDQKPGSYSYLLLGSSTFKLEVILVSPIKVKNSKKYNKINSKGLKDCRIKKSKIRSISCIDN